MEFESYITCEQCGMKFGLEAPARIATVKHIGDRHELSVPEFIEGSRRNLLEAASLAVDPPILRDDWEGNDG